MQHRIFVFTTYSFPEVGMEKKKKLRPLFYYVTKCLNKKWRTAFTKFLVHRKCGSYILDLPDDLSAVKNILFIMPESPLEALLQVVNIFSIINHFNKNHKVQAFFLCEKKVTPYFKNFHSVNSLFEYDTSDRYLFSQFFVELEKNLCKEYIDLVIFLERTPDHSLLYIASQVQANVRVAYNDTGPFPFFNLHTHSANSLAHQSEQNNVMARVLGADIHEDLHWSVTKETVEEISVMLKESSIPETHWLGGIDVQLFYYSFGAGWTEMLIDTLTALPDKMWYCYVTAIPATSFLNWLKARKMPVFTDLSPSRLAALLNKSDIIISGRAMYYELAALLQRPSIGIFREDELHQYCRLSSQSIGIPYLKNPDEETITRIGEKVTLICESEGEQEDGESTAV